MRIAVCVNHFDPFKGGCEIVTKKIAEHYAKKHTVRIFTRHTIKRKESNIGSLSISSYNPSNTNSFLKRIQEYKPEFTLIYSDVFDFFNVAIETLNNVCLAFCGGNRVCEKPYALKFLKDRKDKIKNFVCHTENERDYRMARQIGILDKTHIIPNGIDLEEFDNNNIGRKELGIPFVEGFWLLNVSNFFPGKGQIHLIDILKRTKTRPLTYIQVCSSVEFSIGKQLESQWRAKANSLKGDVNVVIMKDKSREKVVSAFNNSNCFAFSSEKESAGLVLLESMAASCPWVSANVGISSDIEGGKVVIAAKNAQYNAIFDDRVKDEFATKIDECLSDPELGDNGRENVENDYQWKYILPLYDGLL